MKVNENITEIQFNLENIKVSLKVTFDTVICDPSFREGIPDIPPDIPDIPDIPRYPSNLSLSLNNKNILGFQSVHIKFLIYK